MVLGAMAAVTLVVHLIADHSAPPEGDRWLYYTRTVFYALGFLALAVLSARWNRWIVPQFFGVLMLLSLLDLTYYFLRGRPAIEHSRFELPDYPPDHPAVQLGELPNAGEVQIDVKMKDGDTLYHAAYTIDELLRRHTPGHDSSRTHHAIFFGCSVCYGQWMSDDQTLPACFQRLANGFNAYNYAYSGWGTEQMVARLEYQDLSTQVPEPEGIAVYVFIWPHIYRAIGDMYTYCSWGFQHPYYELVDGEAQRNKRFKDGRPVLSTVYELLWRSNIVRYYELNLPLAIQERHLRLNVAMVQKAKALYQQQFPKGRFVVLWAQDWPYPTDVDMQSRYVEMLHEAGIDLIDCRRPDLMDEQHYLVDDGHPTALAHAEMATMLVHGLDSLRIPTGPNP